MPTRSEYAKINIGCKELGIDKYEILAARYGLESSKDLKPHQVRDLLAHLKDMGWKPKASKNKQTGKRYPETYQRKVQALWITMEKAGVIRTPGDTAMNRWVKKMTTMDNLRFCGYVECSVLIEGLKSWAWREGVDVD